MTTNRGLWIRKLLLLIPTIVIITLLAFSVLYFSPGDAGELLLKQRLQRADFTEEEIAQYNEILGLNKSYGQLYIEWVKGAIKGDFGESLSNGKDVLTIFVSKFKITLAMSIFAIFFEMIFAIPIGLRAGMKPKGICDKLVQIWSIFTSSFPAFWVALVIVWFLAMKLRFKNTIGYRGIQSVILPAFIMAIVSIGHLSRIVRKKSFEIMNESFVEFAYSQGLNDFQILRFHVLPHVWPTAISMLVLSFSRLLGGAVLIENIFNIPGFSGLLMNAINVKDYPLISGSLFFIGIMVSILNFIADTLYISMDKRNESEILQKSREVKNEKVNTVA